MMYKKLVFNVLITAVIIALSWLFSQIYGDAVLYRGIPHKLKLLDFFIASDGEKSYDLIYYDSFIYAISFFLFIYFLHIFYKKI